MEEILHQLISSLSHYLQGFIHPRLLAGFLNHQQYVSFRDGITFLSLDKNPKYLSLLPHPQAPLVNQLGVENPKVYNYEIRDFEKKILVK